ncbi:hypothetical protein D3C87_1844050 [compost metagenome]
MLTRECHQRHALEVAERQRRPCGEFVALGHDDSEILGEDRRLAEAAARRDRMHDADIELALHHGMRLVGRAHVGHGDMQSGKTLCHARQDGRQHMEDA